MKLKNENIVTVNGYIYNFGSNERSAMVARTSKSGVPYVGGDINIALDPDCTNVVNVHFTYVAPTFGKTTKPNPSYNALVSMLEAKKTVQDAGLEQAMYVSIRGSVSTNDYIGQDGQRHESMRIEGNSIALASPSTRPMGATFKGDMYIDRVTRKEDSEGVRPDYLEIAGCMWDWRNAMVPVTFESRDPAIMEALEAIGDELPYATTVKGNIKNVTTVKQVVKQGIGGLVDVDEQRSYDRCFEMTFAGENTFDDTVTKEDITAAAQAREIHWGEVEKQREEYLATKAAAPKATPAAPTAAPATGGLDSVRAAAAKLASQF